MYQSTSESVAVFKPNNMAFVVGIIILSLIGSVSFPLFTYGTTLALFGAAHVLSELRFIDLRYGTHISRTFKRSLALLLIGIVIVRTLMAFKIAPLPQIHYVELALISGLIFTVITAVSAQPIAQMIVVAVGIIFSLFITISPITVLLLLALFHNLTPVVFIIDAVPAKHKRWWSHVCYLIFIFIPVVIGLGALSWILQPLIGIHQEASFLPTGSLEAHFNIYVPSILRETQWAVHFFSAAVFAQCMHYLAVIYVMPKLIKKYSNTAKEKSIFSWPKKFFVISIALISSLLFMGYYHDFFRARLFYGILAAVHAYLELPILLLVFITSVSMKKPVTLTSKMMH